MDQAKTKEFVKSLSEFFKRDLISIPLIKKYPHQQFSQRCGLRAATLEFDTAAYPNIEYIAGNRLSVYPMNLVEHVNTIMKYLVDDLGPNQHLVYKPAQKRPKTNDPWSNFVNLNGRDSLKLALLYLYDINTAPSRNLLRILAECCRSKEHKSKLVAICKSEESWETWICQSLRTLKSTFDEFSSCSNLSAKSLLSELAPQQPRQYSISSIKSSKRFRTEIIVFQHKFTSKEIAVSLQNIKERDKIQVLDGNTRSPGSNQPRHVNHNESSGGVTSMRSLRSMAAYTTSPISSQQVRKVPSFSGPLMSMYANSSLNQATSKRSSLSQFSFQGTSTQSSRKANQVARSNSAGNEKQYEGLCSTYLLNLNSNDYIVCEFVENPRFTLKGNRERPIMMIGQDVGVIAFRPFWQQRALEHDRAQVFYTLFKDLSPKKFGDMQLFCLTGNKCRVEDLFRRELNSATTNKIISSANYINKAHLNTLLEGATLGSQSGLSTATKLNVSKELVDLGNRIHKLLVDNNGCLYTCCDARMTQAIEILTVESVARNSTIPREEIMALLPQWKGRRTGNQSVLNNKFLFTLENPFERAQIVQEIYESSI